MQQTTTGIKISTQIKRNGPTFNYCSNLFNSIFLQISKYQGLVWNLVNWSPPRKSKQKTKRGRQQLYLNKTLSLFFPRSTIARDSTVAEKH